MSKARSQMPQKSGRVEAAHGEAVGESASDEARDPLAEHRDTGLAKTKAGTGGLLEAALARENMQMAWERVKANKGAAGVDGRDIEQTAQDMRTLASPQRVTGRHLPAKPGAQSADTQSGWKPTRTGHTDGAGQVDTASPAASAATPD